MFSNEIFASRLLALCKEKNVTQQILADQLGLSFHQVSKMEAGQRGASLEVAYALADFFNCSIDYLVGRSDTPYMLKNENVELLSPEELELLRILRNKNRQVSELTERGFL